MNCDECGKRIEVGDTFVPLPEKNIHEECFEETHLLPLLHVATQRLGGGTFPSGRIWLHGNKVIENLDIIERGPMVCPFMSRRISIPRFGSNVERLVAQPCIGARCQVWEGHICGVLAAAHPVTRLVLTPEVDVTAEEVEAIIQATAGAGVPVTVDTPDDDREFAHAVDEATTYTDRDLKDLGEG